MSQELRQTGISVVGEVPWGTHFCHFYETKEDLLDILIPYFKAGLENNEFCMWVVSDPLGEAEARKAFRQAVNEADRYLAARHIEIVPHTFFLSRQQTTPSGRLEIVPHTDWYLKGGAFVAERVINEWNEKLAEALAKGYDGMRANGNEAWLTKENRGDFFEYERTLDEKLGDKRMIALCSYPLSGSTAAEIFDLAHTHQLAVVRRRGNWEVVETPDLKKAKAEINRLNQELDQRVIERTQELAAANELLKQEIAERWRAEDRTRLIIDTIPVMAWSVRCDGIVDFLNQRWMDYAGLSLEQYVADPTGPIHPQDAPRIIETWRARMALGEGYDEEMRLRRADGKYRWFLVRTAPLRDEAGKVIKWYGVSTDIEDRKRAEEKLSESENQLAEAQRLAHTGSWTWDLRTGALTWSDELYRIYGLQPQEIDVIHEAVEFIHPEDRDLVTRTLESARKAREPYSYYYRILRRGGEERIVHSIGTVVSDELGTPIRIFGATQDVTERKRAEEQLRAATAQSRALSARLQSAREEEGVRIAREIHDELGSVLTRLRWELEGLGKAITDSTNKSQLQESQEKIDAMIGLTESVVHTVRRISSELRPQILDDLGLAAAVEWQAAEFQTRTGIVSHCDSPPEKPNLNQAQATAVFRILQEALTNVLRHAEATRVDIKLEEELGSFVMTISDNGRGITEEEKSAEASLGLLGIRERAELIGGTAEISGVEGSGTTITIRVGL